MTTEPSDNEAGASAVEYGLIVVAIAAVIAAVVFVVGGYVQGQFQDTCHQFETVGMTNNGASVGDCNS
jgi:pilus assembly protein Flp/PilA